jgi:hypothetical protein
MSKPAACAPCVSSKAEGWWGAEHRDGNGNALTHCSKCHSSWRAASWAHCKVCCTTFTGNSVADLHWVLGRHSDASRIPALFPMTTEFGVVYTSKDPDAPAEV